MMLRIKRLIAKLLRPDVIEYFGVKLNVSDNLISDKIKGIVYDYRYERKEIEILTKVLDQEDKVLDIGAGMGFISIFCAKVLGDNKVCSIEANPRMLPLIEKNCEINNVSLLVHNVILSNENITSDFYIEKDFYSSSELKRSSDAIKISVDKVDASGKDFADYNFVILDVEGGEFDFFNDVALTPKVNKLMVELHPHVIGHEKVNHVIRMIMGKGFLLDVNLSGSSVYYFFR